jgi:hypothetical protein
MRPDPFSRTVGIRVAHKGSVNDVVKTAAHLLGHVATTIVGIALVVIGLGMTVTIVFATGGIIFMAVGVSLIVGGMFAHAMAGP